MNNLLKFPFFIKSVHKEGLVEGYASVFNVFDSENDVVLPGAFQDCDKQEVKFLWQHLPEEPIGNIINLYEDVSGLYMQAQLILSVRRAYEAYMLIKENALNGLSIGYIPIFHEDKVISNKYYRYLKKIDLKEISLVTFPANKWAKITKIQELKNDSDITIAIDNAIKILT